MSISEVHVKIMSMKHRVFIAINLPENIKKKLSEYEMKWPELPCRWTKRYNLHITLAFLGYLTEEELLEICKNTKEVALKHEPFSIKLNKIIYGPPDTTPRMVWAEGEKSQELGNLQQDLNDNLIRTSPELKSVPRSRTATGMVAEGLVKEGRPRTRASSVRGRAYSPHITIGRLKQWEFRKIEPEERPEINEEINLTFEVESIEVMESELKKTGPVYTVLESESLKN